MSSVSFTGLATGLDTASIVAQLLEIKRRPIYRLENRRLDFQSQLSALGTLKTKLLALQEAARDIFRTKLHNLGVQFSIAVTEKQWTGAFNIGRQIIKDFPNSRMSHEIRAKMEAHPDGESMGP